MAESGGTVRELLAVFGFGVDTKELKHGENQLGHFFDKVKEIGEGIIAAFAVEQIYEFAEAQVRAIVAVEHLAAQVGISTEEVQKWQFAAESAGFESDRFVTAMSRLQVAAQNDKGGSTFKSIGVDIKDASGHAKNASELFTDVAEAIKKTEDPNKRAAIATKFFGRSGREILPFLVEGKEGIEELTKAYSDLGTAYSEEQIHKTKDFEKQQAKLSATFKALKGQIATAMLPALVKISEWVTKLSKGFISLVKNSNIVQSTLLLLGVAATAFAVQMAIAAAPVLFIVAALAFLALAVDEIITLFQGGDTIIGDAIDKIFGKGYSVELVKEIKEEWLNIKSAIASAVPYIKQFFDITSKVAGALRFAFTHLADTGAQIGDFFAKEGIAEKELWYSLKHPKSNLSASQEITSNPFSAFTATGLSPDRDQMGSTPVVINQTINASPGMDEKKIGQHAANETAKVLKQERRAAASTLQRTHQ